MSDHPRDVREAARAALREPHAQVYQAGLDPRSVLIVEAPGPWDEDAIHPWEACGGASREPMPATRLEQSALAAADC